MTEKLDLPTEDNQEKQPSGETFVSQLEEGNEEDIQAIISLDKEIFPDMPIEESELRGILESAGVQTVLKKENSEIIGYIISLPHNQIISSLKEFDPDLTEEKEFLYIGSMGIAKENRNLKNFLLLWKNFITQAKKEGYIKITGHFRVSQGLSSVLEKKFGGKKFRRMEYWGGVSEPFDYLEIDISKEI